MPTADVLFYSLVGGIVPAVLWLLFWLQEDKKRPEPRGLLMMTFVAGMIVVPVAAILQFWTQQEGNLKLTFFIWAIIEELLKFGVAYIVALRRKEMNEPVDALIYMMTAALGFAAAENALFLFSPLSEGNVTESLITGNIRFVGASLLHTICSAAIGIAIAISFYRDRFAKIFDISIGIMVAIVLHTAFNLFIIEERGGTQFATLGFVWIAIVILMLFFEKIKSIYPVNRIE
jgi:RsiW-degrading membrane proteinase PrsW (M82 family)